MADNTNNGNPNANNGDGNADTGNSGVVETVASDTGSDDTGGLRTINPSDGTIKRGRGRPPGSGKSQSATTTERPSKSGKTAQNAIGIDTVLFSLHQMAAAFIAPEMAIDETEAKQLALGIAAVNEFYGKVIDPKITAWIGLVAVCGKVYGPRVGAYMLRKDMERNAKPRPGPLAGNTSTVSNAQAKQAPQKLTPEVVSIFSDPANVSLPSE